MSVVRIPRPEEDAFPWPRVAAVTVIGAALGLGIAYWGMERDRSAEAEAENVASGSVPEPDSVSEPDSVPEPASEAADSPPPLAPEPDAAAAPPGASTEPAPLPVPDAGAPDPVAIATTPTPAPPSIPSASGPVTLRTGRVAYLRCDGVPQRPGPFPCPRDEPLEIAVWEALRAVERCDRAPTPGAADIVVDVDGEQPTIRARDTFPADTVRTDASALLACAGDPLGNVRSTLSPRRLVVSFRLTLEARAR